VANPDLPDTHNTVLKMSNKRALVAAVLNVTAASEIFTQDVADKDERDDEDDEAPPRREEPRGQGGAPQGERRQDPDIVINENQVKRFSAIASGQKWTEDEIHSLLSSYQYNSRKDIKIKDYEAIVERLKAGPSR
jgi:hypothetical protein